MAKVRHYNSARHAALAANFIPESVYDSLLESVNKHLPLLHRYLDLRKKVLELDKLKMYDVYAPLSETETALTYEEALKKAEEVLAIFGEEYSKEVHAAFTERWIDVHPNKGKRSVCIQLSHVRHNHMFTEITQSSWLKLRLQLMKIS